MTAHQIVSIEASDGKPGFACTACLQKWKAEPMSACPGVPVYGWGKWPEHLLTKKQMGAAGFQTGKKLPPPAGAAHRDKSPDGWLWLYDKGAGVPKRPISDEQKAKLKAAAEKSRAGWYCTRCGQPIGWVDGRGYFHAQHQTPPGLCMICADHDAASQWARDLLAGEFLVLDTETSGLEAGYHEIVQIAVINQAGDVLLDTYVQPQHPERLIERINGVSASDINGITLEMLADAPLWPEVAAQLRQIVHGKTVIIYNADFDEGMIGGDCRRHSIPPLEMETACAMLMYAQFVGDYSPHWDDYRWQPLNGGHTALADCRACLEVIREMAKEAEEKMK